MSRGSLGHTSQLPGHTAEPIRMVEVRQSGELLASYRQGDLSLKALGIFNNLLQLEGGQCKASRQDNRVCTPWRCRL